MSFNKIITASLGSALLTLLACNPVANAPAMSTPDTSTKTQATDMPTTEMPMEKMFTVTLKSPTEGGGPLAPGVFVIHRNGMPLFTSGSMDMGKGLEALAEDGNPAELSKTTGSMVFNTPVGDSKPGPATPGKSYQFSFKARPGDRLSFAVMYVQSNDLFYAPMDTGLELFTGNTPMSGDLTSKVMLWDAGTEINQKPGEGADQAPRQAGPNTGAMEKEPIQMIADRKDGFSYTPSLTVMIETK